MKIKTKHTLTPISQEQTEAKAEVIKLGIDVHQRKYVVVSQADNEMMRSPRSFGHPKGSFPYLCG